MYFEDLCSEAKFHGNYYELASSGSIPRTQFQKIPSKVVENGGFAVISKTKSSIVATVSAHAEIGQQPVIWNETLPFEEFRQHHSLNKQVLIGAIEMGLWYTWPCEVGEGDSLEDEHNLKILFEIDFKSNTPNPGLQLNVKRNYRSHPAIRFIERLPDEEDDQARKRRMAGAYLNSRALKDDWRAERLVDDPIFRCACYWPDPERARFMRWQYFKKATKEEQETWHQFKKSRRAEREAVQAENARIKAESSTTESQVQPGHLSTPVAGITESQKVPAQADWDSGQAQHTLPHEEPSGKSKDCLQKYDPYQRGRMGFARTKDNRTELQKKIGTEKLLVVRQEDIIQPPKTKPKPIWSENGYNLNLPRQARRLGEDFPFPFTAPPQRVGPFPPRPRRDSCSLQDDPEPGHRRHYRATSFIVGMTPKPPEPIPRQAPKWYPSVEEAMEKLCCGPEELMLRNVRRLDLRNMQTTAIRRLLAVREATAGKKADCVSPCFLWPDGKCEDCRLSRCRFSTKLETYLWWLAKTLQTLDGPYGVLPLPANDTPDDPMGNNICRRYVKGRCQMTEEAWPERHGTHNFEKTVQCLVKGITRNGISPEQREHMCIDLQTMGLIQGPVFALRRQVHRHEVVVKHNRKWFVWKVVNGGLLIAPEPKT